MQGAAHFLLGTRGPGYGPASEAEQLTHLRLAVQFQPHWGAAHDAFATALEKKGQPLAAKQAHARAAALGFHDSLPERIARQQDENMREHMFLYHPNQPERYHFHDPQMQPTPAEVAQYQKTGQFPPSPATLREARTRQEAPASQP